MNKSQVNSISVFLLSLIIIIINEPILSRLVKGAGVLLLMLIFLLFNLPQIISNGVLKSYSSILALAYISLEILYKIIGVSDASLISYYNIMTFFFFSIVVVPVIPLLTRRQQNIIIQVIVISILIMMISNIRLSNKFGSYYVRIEDYYDGLTNSVNTQYISALIVYCGVLLAKIKLSRKNNLITECLLLFSIYFIVAVGQRLIAIILLFAVVMSLLVFTGRKSLKKMAIIIALIFMGTVALMNYEIVLKWIASIINNDRLSHRINQLIKAFNSRNIHDGSGGSLEVRYELICISFRTFVGSFTNFIFGVGSHDKNNLIIGNHSQWIDQAAKYGVLGCVMLYLTIRRCFKDVYSYCGIRKGDPFNPFFGILIVYFIIRGTIGVVLYPHFGEMMFVFLPIVYLHLQDKRNDVLK